MKYRYRIYEEIEIEVPDDTTDSELNEIIKAEIEEEFGKYSGLNYILLGVVE